MKRYEIGKSALAERPTLAAIIAECLSIWSYIELELSLALAGILKTSAETAASALFLKLSNARAQREVLDAAGSTALQGDKLKALRAVLAVHKMLDSVRNDLAHGIFGYAHEQPDILLWISQKDYAADLVRIYREERARISQGPDPHGGMKERMFFYRDKDLREIQRDMTELHDATQMLHWIVRDDGPVSITDHTLPRLFALPQIRAEVDRMK